MLEAEAPETESIDRQVFWLSAPDGRSDSLPRLTLVSSSRVASSGVASGGLADHSGGPATDLHRFPYCPAHANHGREPVENYASLYEVGKKVQ